jgi:hypothetical protein
MVIPGTNPVPMTVTTVPGGPEVGVMPVTVKGVTGGGIGVGGGTGTAGGATMVKVVKNVISFSLQSLAFFFSQHLSFAFEASASALAFTPTIRMATVVEVPAAAAVAVREQGMVTKSMPPPTCKNGTAEKPISTARAWKHAVVRGIAILTVVPHGPEVGWTRAKGSMIFKGRRRLVLFNIKPSIEEFKKKIQVRSYFRGCDLQRLL